MKPNLSYLFVEPPLWLAIAFAATTAITFIGFLKAVHRSVPKQTTPIAFGLLGWLLILGVLAAQHFFTTLTSQPPRLPLAILPPFLLIAGLFSSSNGRAFLDKLPLSTLTYIHTIRIPVELVLYALYIHHQIPELMTFEGRNVDILAGLTAPVIAYFSFNRPILSNQWLMAWNVVALALLLNIVTHALLSAPSPFQQLAFQQPNIGILKFPFIWLPGFVVPIVLLSHLVAFRQLYRYDAVSQLR